MFVAGNRFHRLTFAFTGKCREKERILAIDRSYNGSMANTKNCRVKNCDRASGPLQAICNYHWRRVPQKHRAEIWALKQDVPENPGWEKLLREAIAVIEKTERGPS